MSTEDRTTRVVKRRYDRIAPVYDLMESLMERSFRKWRQLLWSKVEGTQILEIGVGTGKNFPYYPSSVEITAIDLSGRMLARARDKAATRQVKVRLQQMDVQQLQFPDNTFDTVVASFVFCSVPDPLRGLEEAARVCKPGGKVVLLEHVLSTNRIMAWLMNLLNPLVVRIGGENINRRTVVTLVRSGLSLEQVTNLSRGGVFQLIEARKERPFT